MGGDYFHARDRVPYDGGLETSVLDHLNARVEKLPIELRERLDRLHVPFHEKVMVKLLVCDAYDFGRNY